MFYSLYSSIFDSVREFSDSIKMFTSLYFDSVRESNFFNYIIGMFDSVKYLVAFSLLIFLISFKYDAKKRDKLIIKYSLKTILLFRRIKSYFSKPKIQCLLHSEKKTEFIFYVTIHGRNIAIKPDQFTCDCDFTIYNNNEKILMMENMNKKKFTYLCKSNYVAEKKTVIKVCDDDFSCIYKFEKNEIVDYIEIINCFKKRINVNKRYSVYLNDHVDDLDLDF